MGRLVCLGEILVDCFADEPIRHSASESVTTLDGAGGSEESAQPPQSDRRWVQLPGGGPANVACALKKLGHEVDFVGAVGTDAWGAALLQLLADMTVGSRGVQRRQKAPTREVYRLRSANGEHRFVGFNAEDPACFADAHLFADALPESLIADADGLVLGTVSLAYADSYESVLRAVEIASNARRAVFFDVNWQPMFWRRVSEAPGRIYDLLPKVQFLKVTAAEADWLFGTVSASAIAAQLPYLKGVFVTSGMGPCDYAFGAIAGRVSGFDVEVEDLTGAGDAFTAAAVHQWLKQGEAGLVDELVARQMVTYACAMSALTTTRPGAIAGLPSPNEIEAFLYLN